MGNTDATRVEVSEGAYTFQNRNFATLLREIDERIMDANTFMTLTRTSGYLTKSEYFADSAKTLKIYERQYTYTTNRITGVTHIFYNLDGTTEDARVTHTIARAANLITADAAPFTTSESTET